MQPATSPRVRTSAHSHHGHHCWANLPWHVKRTFTMVFVITGLTLLIAADLDGWPGVVIALLGNIVSNALLIRWGYIKRKFHAP